MDNPFSKFLSGYDLVQLGYTKVDTSLPEVGLKQVVPDGSWLEQKQIQAALEGRKQIIGVPRIIKPRGISHGEWLDDLKLAMLTNKVGGHWRFFSHRIGLKWYLKPEEALFLMECNNLVLHHNYVIVSLQKAYALLLDNDMTLTQYKVYASLSRVGFKIFRHKEPVRIDRKRKSEESPETSTKAHKSSDTREVLNESDELSKENDDVVMETVAENPVTVEGTSENTDNQNINNIEEDTSKNTCNNQNYDTLNNIMEKASSSTTFDKNGEVNNEIVEDNAKVDNDIELNANYKTVETRDETDLFNVNSSADFSIDANGVIRIVDKKEMQQEIFTSMPSCSNEIENTRKKKIDKPTNSYQLKLQKLRNRKTKRLNPKIIEETFANIPNICNQPVVTINVPDEKFLPRNIYLNNCAYVLNIEQIRTIHKPQSTSSTSEVPTNARRIGSSPENVSPNTETQPFIRRFPRFQNPYQFRPPWRLPLNINYFPLVTNFFPRPHLPSFYAHRFRFHQFQTFARPDQFVEFNRQPHFPNPPSRRPSPQMQLYHLQAIKNLAARVQRLSQMFRGIDTSGLYKLLAGYNSKYNERLRLTRDFEVINMNEQIEVIELDDDEESSSKKRRIDENNFDKHLNSIKVLTGKLKELVDKNQSSSRHRRAINNLIKKFNRSFNADIYMDSDYNIIDRKFINLDSSSENELKKKTPKRKKKLRNPFNILKQMSDKVNSEAVISEHNIETLSIENPREILLKYFKKEWLPDDFGRPEVCTKYLAQTNIAESREDELLFDFLKDRQTDYKNWLDLKMSFVKNLEASSLAHENQQIDILSKDFMMDFDSKFKPIIGPEDCKDMPSVLEKLRIIRTRKYEPNDTSLRIHFDAYNRDVNNYGRSDPPPPHFRIICIEESSEFPSGSDIAALHSRYDDNIPIVFAIVGLGSTSYLRMNPNDLEVYIPTSDLV